MIRWRRSRRTWPERSGGERERRVLGRGGRCRPLPPPLPHLCRRWCSSGQGSLFGVLIWLDPIERRHWECGSGFLRLLEGQVYCMLSGGKCDLLMWLPFVVRVL